MEILTLPSSIELDVSLSTKGSNASVATTNHTDRIEQLTSYVSLSGGQLIDSDNSIELVKPSGILKIRSAERTAVSNFKILLYSDQQISDVIDTLFKTDGSDIKSYEVIYDASDKVSDNDLTTELTNKIISTISTYSKENGKQILPKGISQMDITNQELGLDYMDSLVSGLVLDGWKKSEDEITLIQRSKKIELALIAK